LCVAIFLIDYFCALHYIGAITRRIVRQLSWKGNFTMVKVEDIQQFGKEQFESVVSSTTNLQNGLHAIASAYGDYTQKSFEGTKSYVEKLSGVKSLDKAIEVQTEFAKSSYETFVAEAQKIAGLYGDLAKQSFKPVENIISKFRTGGQ